MKEQDAAHSFEKTNPDFPQWIETEAGKGCLQWPISEIKYLRNRLFWAFDAGRNCVWDQYTEQKAELTRLRSELQQERDKARNQAIQECIDIVSRTQFYLGYNPTEALEQLKTKP